VVREDAEASNGEGRSNDQNSSSSRPKKRVRTRGVPGPKRQKKSLVPGYWGATTPIGGKGSKQRKPQKDRGVANKVTPFYGYRERDQR